MQWKELCLSHNLRLFDLKKIHSLKYQRTPTSGCKDVEISKSEFVAKTQFPSEVFYVLCISFLLFLKLSIAILLYLLIILNRMKKWIYLFQKPVFLWTYIPTPTDNKTINKNTGLLYCRILQYNININFIKLFKTLFFWLVVLGRDKI